MSAAEPHDADRFVEALTTEECLAHAATVPIGRLAVGQGDGPPHVVPVNFVLDGDVVVFRSDVGTKLQLVRGAAVTFEVDAIDVYRHSGWSVIFQGPAYEASHWETDHLQLEPWIPGSQAHWVRILPAVISGRRIRLAEVAPSRRGYL
jgi:nitroimidazol reductase NimA-like FMN-containing flavoprotein (pyridoxamine 5'-phosphate oxidase superfamily)